MKKIYLQASCQCNCEDYLNSQDLNDTAQTLGDDTSDTESVSYNEGSSPNGLKSACGLQIYAGTLSYYEWKYFKVVFFATLVNP